MRNVTRRRGPRHHDEQGAVLVIAAVFSLVAILFIAFVVDIGNQRQNRRQLATQTDSVALAVARDWAGSRLSSTYSCETNSNIDETLGAANSPTDNPTPDYTCEFSQLQRRRGVVSVWDREVAQYAFGGVTGISQGGTGALTRVSVTPVRGAGLRPLALCALEPQLAAWIVQFTAGTQPAQSTLTFTKEGIGCGGASGNWGMVQVPGAGNGADQWRDAVLNGAPENSAIGDLLPPQTGIGMNSAETTFAQLKATEPIFHLPVYQNNPGLPPGGPGNNARYQVLGYLEVELVNFVANGSTADLTVKPLSYDTTGPCCTITPYNAEYQLCDVGTPQGQRIDALDSACLAPLVPPVIPDLEEPTPDPVCQVGGVNKVAPQGSVSLTSGSSKYTEQQAIFNVTFSQVPVSCGNLSYRLYQQQGSNITNITMQTGPAAVSGNTVQINLPVNTLMPYGGGTYSVQVLRDGTPLSPPGSLQIAN